MNESQSLSSELRRISVRNYRCSESVNQMKEIEGCMEKIGLTPTPHTSLYIDSSLTLIHSGSFSQFRTILADVRDSQSLSHLIKSLSFEVVG